MNQKQTEQKSMSLRRILTVSIALISVVAVVIGCLMLAGCGKKKPGTTSGAPSAGASSSVGGDTSGGTTGEGDASGSGPVESGTESGGTTESGSTSEEPSEDIVVADGLLSKKEGVIYFSTSSVSVTEKGTVYASDATNFAVYKLDGKGKVEKTALFDATVNKVVATDSAVYVLAGELGGKLFVLDSELNVKSKIAVGHTPTDLYVKDSKAYVANRFSNTVSVVDLSAGKVTSTVEVGREPMCLTEAKGSLYVGCHLPEEASNAKAVAANVVKIDLASGKVTKTIELVNGSQSVKGIVAAPDGSAVYVTHLISRYTYPTSQLDRGWINTNGFTMIDTSNDSTVAFLLDDIELGAANPWDVEIAKEGRALVFSLSGTNELMVLDLSKLKSRLEKLEAGRDEYVSSKEEIVDHIEYLTGLKTRIKLTGVGARDIQVVGDKIYVAEYFSGTVSLVDVKSGAILDQYKLGDQPEATPERLGETIWYDATLCYQQWESCASCHPDARADALNWDNLNDGLGNPKNTKSMLFSHRTPPVMITGARDSAELAVRKGMLFIQFNVLDEMRLCAIDEYLKSLMPTDSPYLKEDGTYTEAALRGEKLFEEVGCAVCHPAPLYTDLKFHESPYLGKDDTWENRKFITPTLVEVWRSAPYTYCGMVTDMKELVKEFSNRKLTDAEAADLAEFVLSIGTVNEKYGVEQVLSKNGDTTIYSKIVAGTTIETITVRKQIPSVSKVEAPVITVKLCGKDGKVIEEKTFTPGAMVYNTATKLDCGIKVPADFADGGYLEVTIADSKGVALASPYKLVCGASK